MSLSDDLGPEDFFAAAALTGIHELVAARYGKFLSTEVALELSIARQAHKQAAAMMRVRAEPVAVDNVDAPDGHPDFRRAWEQLRNADDATK